MYNYLSTLLTLAQSSFSVSLVIPNEYTVLRYNDEQPGDILRRLLAYKVPIHPRTNSAVLYD